MMTDAELLMFQLRNPPVMSMALNKDHLYKMMAESMSVAADVIEQLNRKNDQLRDQLRIANLENDDLLMKINYE
jgi:hypothetical protein